MRNSHKLNFIHRVKQADFDIKLHAYNSGPPSYWSGAEELYTYLNLGGSIGSFCISTMRMTLCFAPELKATPC